jgi:hypothetical protein
LAAISGKKETLNNQKDISRPNHRARKRTQHKFVLLIENGKEREISLGI